RRPGTTVLVRGMVLFPSDRSRVGPGLAQAEHSQNAVNLGLVDQRALGELALPTARLLGQDVPGISLVAANLSRAGELEALRRGPIGLHLRHGVSLWTTRSRPRPRSLARASARQPSASV